MIARVLPKEEWHRLGDLPISELVEFVRPEDVRIVVVEKDEKIVATMTVMRITHLEGTWIDPEHRTPGTVRALLREAAQQSSEWTNSWVITGAVTKEISDIIKRMGGLAWPMESFVLGLGKYGGS